MRALDRKDILKLKGSDLLDFYDNTIKVFNEYNKVKKEIDTLNNKIECCKLKIVLLEAVGVLGFPFLIAIISLIIGFGSLGIINYFSGIFFDRANTFINIIALFVFLILLMLNLTNKKSKQKRCKKKKKLIKNELNPLKSKNCYKKLALDEIENSFDYQNALMVFDDPSNIEYVEKLRKIVNLARANTHQGAVNCYYDDKQHEENLAIESAKVRAYEEFNSNFKEFKEYEEKMNKHNKTD